MTMENKASIGHNKAASLDPQFRSIALQVVHFTWHYFEMMVAMMIGASLFELLARRLPISMTSAIGLRPGTFLYSGGIALSMMLVMVAWMVVRGHGLHHSAEMAVAMLLPVGLVAVVSLMKGDAYLAWFRANYCTAMCVGMLVAMLYRWDHYTGKAGHSVHAAH